MDATTLAFHNLQTHGDLFVNLLKARRDAFILRNRWDLPEVEGMEYDQYDTPASRWCAVHECGQVLAGIRLTPTTNRCGIYSYMIRDAQLGLIDTIPSDCLYFEAPVSDQIWESSRVFVCDSVPARKRKAVQAKLMFEMMSAARQVGASQVLGMVPAVWSRWIARLKLQAQPAGPVMTIDGVKTQVAMMDLTNALH